MSTINSQPSTSSDVVIRVDNLSKKYLLHHQQRERYTALRDVIARGAKNLGRKILNFKSSTFNSQPSTTEEFYALKDVSFEIKQGERVGIIGRNGAGKTTLLKLLSRITEPTTGRITLRGRVASLLEVGTGFHPELTGRENIFLNGAILGMGKAEIKKKFDEIVDFAEIEKFLDTPVKRYSSGMYVRLAFAVAANLEPDILLVDEVLAVGDAAFQKKCLGKMEEVGKEGRTVLFVSHNMASVTRLCDKGLLLKDGLIIENSIINEVVNQYMKSDYGSYCLRKWDNVKKPGNDIVKINEVFVHDEQFTARENYDVASKIGVTVKYKVSVGGHLLTPAFNFYNNIGINLFDSHDTTLKWRRIPKEAGFYESTVWLPPNFLAEGIIIVGVAILTSDPFFVHVHERDVVSFNMVDSCNEISSRGDYVGTFPGMIRPLLEWDLKRGDNKQ